MIQTESIEQLKTSFADQFEADGDGFLYRKEQKGPAIRVNAGEREDFIKAYGRALRYSIWVIAVGTVFVIIGTVLLWPEMLDHQWVLYVALFGMVAVAAGFQLWSRYAPARALRDRLPAKPARSNAEITRRSLTKLTYGQLAIGALAAPFVVWNASRRQDVLHGGGLFWTLAGAALFALVAVQAFRKWRFEAKDRRGGT